MNDPVVRPPHADDTPAADEAPPTAPPAATTPVLTPRPASPLPVPAGYEILCEIGQGGMGVVYRGRDGSLDRPVALKYLGERYAQDASAVARFLYEARITARLQHPGIPPVHAVGTLPDGRPFLAMKLIQGRTLDALLREQ